MDEKPQKIVHQNGNIEYLLNGKRHREDGPAAIKPGGAWFWLRHGKYHREDGPAIIYLGDHNQWIKHWYLNGELYRSMEEWAKAAGIYDTDEFTLLKLKYG